MRRQHPLRKLSRAGGNGRLHASGGASGSRMDREVQERHCHPTNEI
jgi:hypothetical protein